MPEFNVVQWRCTVCCCPMSASWEPREWDVKRVRCPKCSTGFWAWLGGRVVQRQLKERVAHGRP